MENDPEHGANETESSKQEIIGSKIDTNTCTSDTKKDDGKKKVDLLLQATGDAPIMKRKKWSVDPDKQIGSVADFIKTYLKMESVENLFLYVNQTFAPSPDQTIRNLYECYGSDGKLVLHYCRTHAWG